MSVEKAKEEFIRSLAEECQMNFSEGDKTSFPLFLSKYLEEHKDIQKEWLMPPFNFSGKDFSGLTFTGKPGVDLGNSSFRNAVLTHAVFSECIISNVDFAGADVEGVYFNSALEVNLGEARNIEKAKIKKDVNVGEMAAKSLASRELTEDDINKIIRKNFKEALGAERDDVVNSRIIKISDVIKAVRENLQGSLPPGEVDKITDNRIKSCLPEDAKDLMHIDFSGEELLQYNLSNKLLYVKGFNNCTFQGTPITVDGIRAQFSGARMGDHSVLVSRPAEGKNLFAGGEKRAFAGRKVSPDHERVPPVAAAVAEKQEGVQVQSQVNPADVDAAKRLMGVYDKSGMDAVAKDFKKEGINQDQAFTPFLEKLIAGGDRELLCNLMRHGANFSAKIESEKLDPALIRELYIARMEYILGAFGKDASLGIAGFNAAREQAEQALKTPVSKESYTKLLQICDEKLRGKGLSEKERGFYQSASTKLRTTLMHAELQREPLPVEAIKNYLKEGIDITSTSSDGKNILEVLRGKQQTPQVQELIDHVRGYIKDKILQHINDKNITLNTQAQPEVFLMQLLANDKSGLNFGEKTLIENPILAECLKGKLTSLKDTAYYQQRMSAFLGHMVAHLVINNDSYQQNVASLYQFSQSQAIPVDLTAHGGGGYNSLIAVIMKGDAELLASMLQQEGVNLVAKDAYEFAPLHRAVQRGNVKMAELLLEKSRAISSEAATIENSKDFKALITAEEKVLHLKKGWEQIKAELRKEENKNSKPLMAQEKISRTAYEKADKSYDKVQLKTLKDRIFVLRESAGIVNLNLGDTARPKEHRGRTALHFAAEGGHLEMVSLLIRSGANQDSVDNAKKTPLHLAIDNRQWSVARELVINGASVDKEIFVGDGASRKLVTPSVRSLMGALEKQYSDDSGFQAFKSCVDLVPSQGKFPKQKYDDAALIKALSNPADIKVALRLIAANGVNPKAMDAKGAGVLHLACMTGNSELADKVLGANPKLDVNAVYKPQNYEYTPLMLAAAANSPKMMDALLKRGAAVPANLLHVIAARGNFEALQYCLDKKIGDITAKDEHGRTPLEVATVPRIQKLLTEAQDLSKETRDAQGMTPLLSLASQAVGIKDKNRKSALKQVQGALDRGGNPNAVMHMASFSAGIPIGPNAMHLFVKSDFHEALSACITKGGDVSKVDEKGKTPLHVAAENGSHQSIRVLLLSSSAAQVINIQDKVGKTPLHLACENNHGTMQLIQKNADVNILDHAGKTPLHYACMSGNARAISNLLKADAKVNVVDKDGHTPLYYATQQAVSSGNWKMVKVLLEFGADQTIGKDKPSSLISQGANVDEEVKQQLKSDMRPIDYALSRNDKERASDYLGRAKQLGFTSEHLGTVAQRTAAGSGRARANTLFPLTGKISDDAKTNSLFIAIRNGVLSNVESIVKADPTTLQKVNAQGENIFHALASTTSGKFNGDIVKLVMGNYPSSQLQGALAATDTGAKKTPLHYAVESENPKAVKFLLEQGANTNAQDAKGKTPVHIVLEKGQYGMAAAFLKEGADPHIKDAKGQSSLDMIKDQIKSEEVKSKKDQNKDLLKTLKKLENFIEHPKGTKDKSVATGISPHVVDTRGEASEGFNKSLEKKSESPLRSGMLQEGEKGPGTSHLPGKKPQSPDVQQH